MDDPENDQEGSSAEYFMNLFLSRITLVSWILLVILQFFYLGFEVGLGFAREIPALLIVNALAVFSGMIVSSIVGVRGKKISDLSSKTLWILLAFSALPVLFLVLAFAVLPTINALQRFLWGLFLTWVSGAVLDSIVSVFGAEISRRS